MAYKIIHETFWTDPDVQSLSPEKKLLFLYFISSPYAHYSGIYYIPMEVIPRESGLILKDINMDSPMDRGMDSPMDRGMDSPIDRGMDSPIDRGMDSPMDRGIRGVFDAHNRFFLLYDTYYQVVWVKNSLLYQLPNRKLSNQQIKGINNHLKMFQKSVLSKLFIEHYHKLGFSFFVKNDRAIIQYTDTDTDTEKNINKSRHKEPLAASLKIPEDLKKEIAESADFLRDKWKDFDVFVFIQKTINAKIPAGITNNVLASMKSNYATIKNPWGYALSVLKKEQDGDIIAKNLERHMKIKKEEMNNPKGILEKIFSEK